MAIRFKFSPEKARAAIHWIVSAQHDIDLHAALKTFYFADKSHLNAYGRPIFGANYKAMRFGPVPLEVYEMIKGESLWLIESGVENFPWQLQGHRLKSTDNSEPNLDVLSATDILHFRDGLQRSIGMSFNERTSATHGRDWQKANMGIMSYEDMIDDGPNKQAIITHLEANALYMRL